MDWLKCFQNSKEKKEEAVYMSHIHHNEIKYFSFIPSCWKVADSVQLSSIAS